MTYSQCPSCGASSFKEEIICKDHLVSGETFSILSCNNCHLFFTQGAPGVDEIEKYYQSEDYISHTDTTKGIVNRLYHKVRKRTLRKKRDLIGKLMNNNRGRLLDIGSGTGNFLEVMQSAGWEVTGLEPNEYARKKAIGVNKVNTLETKEIGHLKDNHFDVITMWHVLEHVHSLNEQILSLKRLLKEDGLLLIAVPNHISWDAQHYGKDWAAWDVPRHLYHFSPRSMKSLFESRGFKIEGIRPMWFDSFYVSMLSRKYMTGRPELIVSFFTGMISNFMALKQPHKCSSLIYIIRKNGI